MDDVTESTQINKVDEGVVTDSVTEKLSGGATAAGGAAGIDSNIAGSTNTGGSNSGNYEAKTTRTEVPTTQTNRTTKFAPGDVSGMAVTVLVNRDKIKDVDAVRQAVAGFAKFDYDAAQEASSTQPTSKRQSPKPLLTPPPPTLRPRLLPQAVQPEFSRLSHLADRRPACGWLHVDESDRKVGSEVHRFNDAPPKDC